MPNWAFQISQLIRTNPVAENADDRESKLRRFDKEVRLCEAVPRRSKTFRYEVVDPIRTKFLLEAVELQIPQYFCLQFKRLTGIEIWLLMQSSSKRAEMK